MFQKFDDIKSPYDQPVFIWDGNCGFCKYWITVFGKKTKEELIFIPYQEAEELYSQIPKKEFMKASRLIEPEGTVFSGPNSAYRLFFHFRKSIRWPYRWYTNSSTFQWLSDHSYNWIAKNRPFMMKLTKLFWGNNPDRRKPYWLLYLLFLIALIWLVFEVL